jgi:hypothetical protein
VGSERVTRRSTSKKWLRRKLKIARELIKVLLIHIVAMVERATSFAPKLSVGGPRWAGFVALGEPKARIMPS